MAMLKNGRWERFAQELAKGATGDAAYIAAGYKPNRNNASRLKANDIVRNRIAELQERAAVRTELTVADVTENLLRLAKQSEAMASEAGAQAARACWMDAAKLNGLVVDKSQVATENVNFEVRDEPMTDEQWGEQYAEGSVGTTTGTADGADSLPH